MAILIGYTGSTKFHDSGDYGGSGQGFGGTIDEVRVWNVARSQSEIQDNRFDPLTGTEEGLVAYWPFSEGSGSTTADQAGNGHEGTLNGPAWTEVELPQGTRPLFTSTPVTNVTEGETYQYDVVVDDPDGDDANLALSAVTTPSWLSFSDEGGGSGTLTGTPAGSDRGVHQVELEATDEAGETKSQSFRIGVTPPVPTAFPTDGLQLYLDAAGLTNLPDGSAVETWYDGTDAPFNPSQLAETRRPDFITNGIDGSPSVRFDATDDNLTLGSNYLFSERDGITVFAVLASEEDTQIPFFYDFGYHTGTNYGFAYRSNRAGVTTPTDHGGQSNTIGGVHAVGSGTPVVVTGEIRFGQDQRVRINGGEPLFETSISTSQLTANEISEWPFRSTSGGPVTIGQQSKTNNEGERKFAGEMAELIVYDRALTDAERQQVEQHLASEYNITQTPLSGTYTIGSGGDFSTFADATTALSTRGVEGAVTFEVASGTYSEQVTIPTIPGADTSNTVTFRSQSGDSTDVVLEAETGTLVFEETAHVSVEGMTVVAVRESNNNPVRPVVVRGTVEDVRLAHNVFEGHDGTQEAGQVLVYGDQVAMSDFTVEENRFVDTETGVWLRGNDAAGPVIRGNVFENVDRRGVYLRDQTAPQVLSNQLRSGQIGIELRNSGGSTGDEALVANNMIVVNSSSDDAAGRGIYVNGSGAVQVYHNAVNVTDPDPVTQAFLQNGSTPGLDVKNNVWAVPGGGRPMRVEDPSSDQTYEFNDLRTTGAEWVVWGDAIYTSLADYQDGTGQGGNSIDVDPGFVSDTDLTPTSSQVADGGTDLTATVPQDIFGTTRTVPVSMGAVEFDAQAPAFTSTPVRAVPLGDSYQYSVTVEDPDGSDANLTLSAPTRPEWLSFTDEGAGSGTLTGTPAEGDGGVATVVLEAEDGDGQVTPQSFEVGVGNLALSLDGSDDQVATTLDIDQSGATPITMEAWVYPTSASGDRRQVMSSNDGGADWSILHEGNTWHVFTGGGAVSTGLEVETETWQHVAAVFIPGTGVRFYKDGQEIVLSSISTDQNDNPVHLGVNPGNSSERFAGRIEDARVWNVERTASEIEEARWGPLTGEESGLRGYWSMEEKKGLVLLDGSGNGHDGTVRGTQREVSDAPFGHPKFTSTPVRSAEIDASYTYDVAATDTDAGDAGLTLQAATLPGWLSFTDQGSGQGVLSGTPEFTDTGTHTVELEVTDADGQSATQRFLVVVGTFARNGLQGRYYDGYYNDDHSFFEQETQVFTRVDSLIDFEDTDDSWGFGARRWKTGKPIAWRGPALSTFPKRARTPSTRPATMRATCFWTRRRRTRRPRTPRCGTGGRTRRTRSRGRPS